ncbi:MAG: type II toxin-antitoxin system YafQ family toxin [Bacteroidaceae bacterium]|nr:type II toxin-antitoxin system YafQ family toxin [Bacteroidaceae bacterium]
MKYKVITPKRFKKDLVRCQKRGLNMRLIHDVILLLQETGTLPAKYRPHKLVSLKQETA